MSRRWMRGRRRTAELEEQVRVLQDVVAETRRVSEAAMHGDTEARMLPVPGTRDLPDVVALRRALNGTLDRTDAFAREVTGALIAIGEGRLHRRVLLDGLEGGYRRFADDIDVGRRSMIDAEHRAREAEETRLVLALHFEESVMRVAEQVAAATVQLSATAENLGSNADSAVQLASSASGTVSRLEDASRTIESVVSLIASVAHQTKLLALNAQIEAARAGSAGRGFEVVAAEVKSLADTTAQSSSDITAIVERIMHMSTESTEVMRTVEATVREMSPMVDDMRSAVDGTGASGSGEVDLHGLAQMAELLRTEVDTFLTQLRAG